MEILVLFFLPFFGFIFIICGVVYILFTLFLVANVSRFLGNRFF